MPHSSQHTSNSELTIGKLVLSANGEQAQLFAQDHHQHPQHNALPLLVLTLASFFSKTHRPNAPKVVVKKLSDQVLTITYPCVLPCKSSIMQKHGTQQHSALSGDHQQQENSSSNNNFIQLTINFDSGIHEHLDFYSFHWKKPAHIELDFKDSIKLDPSAGGAASGGSSKTGSGKGAAGAFWYGGANVKDQKFPVPNEAKYYDMAPFVLNDIHQNTGTSGQERYWLSSNKVVLTVPWKIPLWTGLGHGELHLQSKLKDSMFLSPNDHLEYSLSVPKNWGQMSLKDFHEQCFHKYLNSPNGHPDLALMEKPIWSTWASYWTDVNEKDVLEFADKIKAHKMPISQMELDDRWTVGYGDFEADPKKFPNLKGLVRRLKDEFQVDRLSAWVVPFFNVDTKNGQNPLLVNKAFVKSTHGDVHKIWWWDCNGNAGTDRTTEESKAPCAYILDMSKPEATDWYKKQLEKMRTDYGIFTYKFDAGESAWLPKGYTLYEGDNPNAWGKKYAEVAASFGNAVEVRHGSGSQHLPIFVRTVDRNSFWDYEGGLNSLIPCALQSSLHGYF